MISVTRLWLSLIALASTLVCSWGEAHIPRGSTGPPAVLQIEPAVNYIPLNWGNAGLAKIGGIPSRSTQCGATVNPTGLTPPQSGDDAATINAAITACAAGDVVQLGTGTFQIAQSEYILLNKGVTLRGSGTGTNCTTAIGSANCWQTTINSYNGAIQNWAISPTKAGANCGVNSSSTSTCTPATGMILVSPEVNYNWSWSGCNLGATNPTTNNCGTTLTADAAQGASCVVVASTTGFSAGQWVLIDENPQVVSTANPVGNGQANVAASPEWLNATTSGVMLLEGGDIPGSYSFVGTGTNSNQRLNEEIHLVASVNSGTNTICFDDPLTLAFRQSGSHDARVYWPAAQNSSTYVPFLTLAGVENMTITRPGAGGIQFAFCAYCWAKNVEVGQWIGGGVNTAYSARIQIDTDYFRDGADLENNGNEYPVGISSASTEVLVTNSIIVRGGKGMVGRGSNSAVISYNYQDDTQYMQSVIGDYWVDMGLNGSHYAGTHHWDFEGNWGDNCDSDETHGNATYHTFFRNNCTGLRTPFTDVSNTAFSVSDQSGVGYGQDGGITAITKASSAVITINSTASSNPFSNGQTVTVTQVAGMTQINGLSGTISATGGSSGAWTMTVGINSSAFSTYTSGGAVTPSTPPAPLRAAGPMAFDYWFAFVGNVLGTAGITTTGNGWSYSGTSGSKHIWQSGYTLSEWNYHPDPNLNGTNTPQFLFKNANYDYVNAAIVDNATGYSQSLPNSLYLSSAPAFFSAGTCTYPWPWVTSQSSPYVQPNSCSGSGLPAKARWDAGTPFAQP